MKAVEQAAFLCLSCVTFVCGQEPGHDDLEDLRPGVAFCERDAKREGLFVTGPFFQHRPLILTQSEATNGARFEIVNQCGKGVLIEEPKISGHYEYQCPPPPAFRERAGTNRFTVGSFWSYGGRSWEPYHIRFEMIKGYPKGPDGEYFACGCSTLFASLQIPDRAIQAAPTTLKGEARIRMDYIVMGEPFLRTATVTNQVSIQIVPDPPQGPEEKQ